MLEKIKSYIKEMSLWILCVLFAVEFLPKELTFVILGVVLAYFIIKNEKKIIWNMPGRGIYIFFLVSGCVLGAINIVTRGYSVYTYIKHIYYVSSALLFWVAGSMIVRVEGLSRECIIKTLFHASVVYSSYDLINAGVQLMNNRWWSLYDYRNLIGAGSFLTIVGIYSLIFYHDMIKSNRYYIIYAYIVCVLSLLIHFSRTLILELVILIAFSGIKRNFSKIKNLVFCVGGGIVILFLTVPKMMWKFLGKFLRTLVEIDFTKTIWNYEDVVQNWRGYEVFCELQKFKSVSFFEKLLGGGFGSELDVMGYAYLVTNEETLPFLHNGYFTQLMIWGGIGVLLYIVWGIKILRSGKVICYEQDRCFIKGLAATMLCATLFVMGPFFSDGVAVLLFYIALLYTMYSKEGVDRKFYEAR